MAGRTRGGALWRAGAVLLSMTLMPGCGGADKPLPPPTAELVPLASPLVSPFVAVQGSVVSDGVPPVVSLTAGALPDGITLDGNGTLQGMPTVVGQWRRFTVQAKSKDGVPLGTESYLLAVKVPDTTLARAPAVSQNEDVLSLSGGWGTTIDTAWAYDPQWNLLWPLEAGTQVSGEALASSGGALVLYVAGAAGHGAFDVVAKPSDPRIGVIAELTWSGDADLDLRLLVGPKLGGAEVNARTPTFVADGAWQAKLELSSASNQGAEAVVLADSAPRGRYAIVAARAGGSDIEVPAWLSLRKRDGTVLAERRFDLILSDLASDSIAQDVAGGKQSFSCLGLLTVGADGEVSYSAAPPSTDPFAAP